MFEKIRDRDGKTVDFDTSKITEAIARAGKATGEFGQNEAEKLTLKVLSLARECGFDLIYSAEEIQDIVERVLLSSTFHKTASAYILYRDQSTQIRNVAARKNIELVENYIQRLDWKVRENSNMGYSLQGLNNFISSDITSQYWLNRVYPPKIRHAHEGGNIHIHDLGLLSPYCVGWDLRDLLKQGFKGGGGKVESGPPKHLSSALGQIVNFFYTLQGETAGAQAFSNFDTLLAPFVWYDNLDYRQIKQIVQEFVFNMNIPTRVGFQTPFTNITMDLEPSPILKQQAVVIGGSERKEVYSDFQTEMNLINRAFAEVMCEGDGKGRAFTFPIPTYNLTADIDWDNFNLEMIWKMTGKYGIPYFSNFVNSDLKPEDARSMCCRLRLDNRELLKRGGGLFGANPLTGSIGVVTVNLPRIGYFSKSEKAFFEHLKKMVILAKKSLSIKRNVLERFTDQNLYPYSKFYLREIKKAKGSYWVNHFSTIGIVGMNEACLNLLGADIGSEKGLRFSLNVMDFLRQMVADLQEETGDIFNLEATPAEGACYRLALLDKKLFPEILCANEEEYRKGAAPFYTNSTQLPVSFTDDIFETLQLQDELQTKYTGGTVLHIYLEEQVGEPEAVKGLIRKVVTNYHLPYFTLTPTFSLCPSHGYLDGQKEKCPFCNEETEVYSRVVGYLRPVKQWNSGKQAEFSMRKSFKLV